MAEEKVKEENTEKKTCNCEPIKISLTKFTKIVVAILLLTITAYMILDAFENNANKNNKIQDVSNHIENTIGEIESEVSGDIMPEV